MDPKRWPKVREAFGRVIELPPAEREAFLDEACGDDSGLREEVESLMSAHQDDPTFLEQPAASLWSLGDTEDGDSVEGTRIGPYRVLRRVGGGGMGVVYAAVRDDDQYRKLVALKLIRGGLETESILRRFRSERQILASLDHPQIAKLLDGGLTEEGLPYFVMEHIEGVPIDRYCEEQSLGLRRRLELFRDVCAAVQYAHQNLVVHRDLKPSNIQVSDDGRVKLLDFGIAKLLVSGQPADTRLTATGMPLMTPDFASPEQVRGSAVTTTSDVYALGALLYTILTGQRPYRLSNLAPHEISQVICERDPERPSALAGRFRKELRGDLDAIVMQAMRKEPEHRYPSAEALSEDVRRHLHGHPVTAARDSAPYRVGKFIRRHGVGVSAAAAVFALVVAFGAAMAYQARQIARERDTAEHARVQAESEQAKAQAVSDFLRDMLASVDPGQAQGKNLTVREVLDAAAAELDEEHELGEQPSVEAILQHTLGLTYMRLGEYERAEAHQRRALVLRRAALGDEDPETQRSMNLLGVLFFRQGRLAETEQLWREALELRRRVLGPEAHRTLSTMSNLAVLYIRMADYDRAETLMKETLEIQRRVLGEDHAETLTTRNNLAGLYNETGRFRESADLHRETLRIRQAALGDDHPDTLQSVYNVAHLEMDLGRYAEACALFSRALDGRLKVLGERHPTTLRTQVLLADSHRRLGRHEEARPLFQASLRELTGQLGEDHEETLRCMTRLGLSLLADGDAGVRRAAELIEGAYRLSHPDDGPLQPVGLETSTARAELLLALNSPGEALRQSLEAERGNRERHGPTHGDTLAAREIRVRALVELGRGDEALSLAAELLDARRRSLGDDHPQTVRADQLVSSLRGRAIDAS